MGTAPVGGTTGAVDAPCSGGEEQVRRSALPLRGANRFIVDHQPFNRNSSEPAGIKAAAPPETSVANRGQTASSARRDSATHPLDEDGTPRERGAIDRDPPRVTRRASCSCRTGTSPSRSVHQWTARAWVPDGVTVVVGLACVDVTSMCTPVPGRCEPLTFAPPRTSPTAVGVSPKIDPRWAGRHRQDHEPTATAPVLPQPSRPERTASQTCSPCSAPATRAAAQCSSQSPTPSRLPVPYAASAPR
jgi:hypothetical protein